MTERGPSRSHWATARKYLKILRASLVERMTYRGDFFFGTIAHRGRYEAITGRDGIGPGQVYGQEQRPRSPGAASFFIRLSSHQL